MATRVPRERLRKWGKRIATWCAALTALSIVAVLVLLHNLDQPWVKRRVQTVVAKELGVDIDYGTVRFALFSGIDVDDLVVFSPPEMRGAARELARIGHVGARWSRAGVERVTLTDATLTIAIDENGRTSLAPIFPHRVVLSNEPASLLGSLPVRAVDATRLTVTIVDTDHGPVVERTTVRGIDLQLQAEPDASSGSAARVRLGSESAPLELDLERHGNRVAEGSAHARAHAIVVATSTDVVVAVDLHVVDQSFVPAAGRGRVAHAAARAHFDPHGAKTDVTLDADVAEGSAQGVVTIPDEGSLVLHRVVGDLDAAGWIPAERANLRCRIIEATLATPPRLADGGGIDVAADVSNLRMSQLRVDTGRLAVRVLPEEASASIHGSIALDGLTLDDTHATGAEIRVDARASPSGALDGTVALHVATLHATAMDAHDANFVLRLGDVLVVDRAAPRGELALTGAVASISMGSTTIASTLGADARARLDGHAPYAAKADLTAARLQMFGLDAPARLVIDATNAVPNFARPLASTGVAHVDVALGDTTAAIDATKAVDAVDYELHARAPSLERIRSLLPADAAAFLPESTAVALDSKGRVERLSTELPEIRHRSKLSFEQPALGSVSARSLEVAVDSRGTTMRHDAEVDVRARELSIAGKTAADEHVSISAKIDRARPAVRVTVASDGLATGKLAVTASFDRARHVLAYDVDGSASQLASLAPLVADVPGLEHVDLSTLELGVAAKGDLVGVIADVGGDGTVRLESRPTATAALNGPLDIRVEHLALGRGDLALAVPKLTVHADFGITGGGKRTVESRLDVGGAYFVTGAHEVDVDHISDRFSATVAGDLRNPDAEVENHIAFSALRQELVPGYPTGDVSLDLEARRDHRGTVRVDRLDLASAAGGTKISVTGNLDVSGARRKLALEGAIEQDLARFSAEAGAFGGRGHASATMQLESADLVTFRLRSDVHLDGVDLSLPREGVAVEALYGEVPIKLELHAANGHVTFVRGRPSSPFALLRFVDQQPLLSQKSFLRARSITTPYATIAPFVANLQIDHNVVSLAQVEMGVRGGRVTGACTLDYTDQESTLEVRLRATGIRSSTNELLDANAAFFVSQQGSSVDGRGEILRIGKRQFIELLDIVDPAHTNASINRVRSALTWGHPARVNLVFNHGFANAHVELGGLASLFRVGDVRGIPTGPVFERMLRTRHKPKGRR